MSSPFTSSMLVDNTDVGSLASAPCDDYLFASTGYTTALVFNESTGATIATLNPPFGTSDGIAYYGGQLYISDRGSKKMWVFSASNWAAAPAAYSTAAWPFVNLNIGTFLTHFTVSFHSVIDPILQPSTRTTTATSTLLRVLVALALSTDGI